jgi:dTDP-4-dehydrorhamnose 3,5-epimerase
MKVKELPIKGAYEIRSEAAIDHRGFMLRLRDVKIWNGLGLPNEWAQESLSYTRKKDTIRGLHASIEPQEAKVVTALTGVVQWVSVDIRKNSPTFGRYLSVILDGSEKNSLYCKKGFAHGCLSLTDDCLLLLRADVDFKAIRGTGIAWSDADLAIDWKLVGKPIISERDAKNVTFREFLESNLSQ